MKTAALYSNEGPSGAGRVGQSNCRVAVLIVLLSLLGGASPGLAQPTDSDEQGAQVLTRGPVHEAFAGIVSYDPEPGVEVTKAPPELIEEVPPEERPEGDNVAWIPGYWAWDDERSDFLWISGTWRALPPGREWLAGYWGQTAQGYQWISGYWADASATETTYLPAPPATVEAGPNIEAPSDDYGWTPGCWLWYQGRYAWRPGYWTQGRADWDWIPAHFVWTPRGYIFVEGFWDYPVERRGMLFAPVYFPASVYSRRGYHYSPRIVIDLGVFSDHLFLRPRYSHYYFGDYYASSYQQGGFYASFSFQTSRHGYDPFYSRQRWTHRTDRAWEHRVAASYQYRRDNEAARPPRTWSAQTRIEARTGQPGENRMTVGVSIDQMAKRKGGPVRFQTVDRKERQQLDQRGRDVQKNREQRRSLESSAGKQAERQPGAALEPVKVPMPRSPIVAKPANQLGRNQTPPKAPKPPKPDPKFQPRRETPARPPNPERRTPQAQRQPEPKQNSEPARAENAPRPRAPQPEAPSRAKEPAVKGPEQSPRNARDQEQKVRQESDRRANAAAKAADETQRNSRATEIKSQQDAQKREQDSVRKNQEQSQRNAQDLERKAQQESERRSKAAAKAADETQRNTRATEIKSQQDAQKREQDSVRKNQEQSQRNAQDLERKAQQESERRSKAAAATVAEETQRNSRELEKKSRQDAEQQGKVAAIRAKEEALRKDQASDQQTRRESVQPVRKDPGADKKAAPKPPKRETRKEEKRKAPSAGEAPVH